ncbi:MAG: hypothetical protein NVS9B2_23400 [Steroidobacteraceae bacterium]
MSTRSILQYHSERITSILDDFRDRLELVLSQAQTKTLRELQRRLVLGSDGAIAQTPGNYAVLRQLDVIFRRAMTRAGFDTLAAAYTSQFAEYLPDFQDTLDQLRRAAKADLPAVRFTTTDTDFFASQALSARDQILSIVDTVAAAAKRSALFSVGGLTFAELTTELRTQFASTQKQALMMADTAIHVFYRTVGARQYELIERDMPEGGVLRYVYSPGPDDGKTRPFCHRMIEESKTRSWTRPQLEALDNHNALSNVWLHAGGFGCRHQILIATPRTSFR